MASLGILRLVLVCSIFIGGNCELNSTEWNLRSVNELSCEGMEDFFDEDTHDDALAISYNKKMYRVMSNVLSIQSLSVRYSGKLINSMKGLKSACPTSQFKWRSGTFKAFGRVSSCSESATGPTRLKCTGDWHPKNPEKTYKNNGKITYIWTDSKKYTLHLHCMHNELSWIVSSTDGKIGQRTKKSILSIISKIGFNPGNAVVIPHDNC